MLATLAVFRVSVAGSAVGLAQAALDEALRHATVREQFGAPLIALGAVSQNVALSWTEIESARALTYRAAALAGSDPLGRLDLSSIAKVGATEAAGRVVDRSVQVMGRFGLVRGSKIERLYRNARPLRVYEGATEVLLDCWRGGWRRSLLMDMELRDAVVLVTGASRGLGAAIALRLAGEGARVVAVARSKGGLTRWRGAAAAGSRWSRPTCATRRPWPGSPTASSTGTAASTA